MRRIIKLLISITMILSLFIIGYADDDPVFTLQVNTDSDGKQSLTITPTSGSLENNVQYYIYIYNANDNNDFHSIGIYSNTTDKIYQDNNTIVITNKGLQYLQVAKGTYKVQVQTRDTSTSEHQFYIAYCNGSETVELNNSLKSITSDVSISFDNSTYDMNITCDDSEYISSLYNTLNSGNTDAYILMPIYTYDGEYTYSSDTSIKNLKNSITRNGNTITIPTSKIKAINAYTSEESHANDNKDISINLVGYATQTVTTTIPYITKQDVNDYVTVVEDANRDLIITCKGNDTQSNQLCQAWVNSVHENSSDEAIFVGKEEPYTFISAYSGSFLTIGGNDNEGYTLKLGYGSLSAVSHDEGNYDVTLKCSDFTDVTKEVALSAVEEVSGLVLGINKSGLVIRCDCEEYLNNIYQVGFYYSDLTQQSSGSEGFSLPLQSVTLTDGALVIDINSIKQAAKNYGYELRTDLDNSKYYSILLDSKGYVDKYVNNVLVSCIDEIVQVVEQGDSFDNATLQSLDKKIRQLHQTGDEYSLVDTQVATFSYDESNNTVGNVVLNGNLTGIAYDSLDEIGTNTKFESNVNDITNNDNTSDLDLINESNSGLNVSDEVYAFSVKNQKVTNDGSEEIKETAIKVNIDISQDKLDEAKETLEVGSDEELVVASVHENESGEKEVLTYALENTTIKVDKFSNFYLAKRKKPVNTTTTTTKKVSSHKTNNDVVLCSDKYGSGYVWNEAKKACEVYTVVNTGVK